MNPSLSCTKDGSTVSCDGSEANNCRLTIQERLDLSSDYEMLTMPTFRLDPEKPFGQMVMLGLQLRCCSINSEASGQKLTAGEHGFFSMNMLHTLGHLVSRGPPALNKEHRRFTRYADLLLPLKEGSTSLLYSHQGVHIRTNICCRSLEELEEIWVRYRSGCLQDDLQSHFDRMHLPFGPISVDVKIHNYEECKRKFQFAGYRLLYLQYPQTSAK